MDSNFPNLPLFNIPKLFTRYRSRVLEESGKQWFHAGNNPKPEAIAQPLPLTPSQAPSGETSPEEISTVTNASAEKTTSHAASVTLEKVMDGRSHPPSFSTEYPDPWLTSEDRSLGDESTTSPKRLVSPLETVLAAVEDREIGDRNDGEGTDIQNKKPSEGVETPKITLFSDDFTIPEIATAASTSTSHPAENINLFPFDEGYTPDVCETLYDLTEFDNGEIEVPPVATRNVYPAKFEKVQPAVSNRLDHIDRQTRANEKVATSNTSSSAQTASADIAKFRLRNCL